MSGKLAPVAATGCTATGFKPESSEYEKLLWAISELEKRNKVKICNIRKSVNSGLQNRIVKLIGSKPLFLCKLDGEDWKVLWDCGSQVCVVDYDWLREHAPDAELRPISDFLDDGEKIEFKAANNTEVPMLGAVVLNFSLGSVNFPVPFVVTSGSLAQPIIGFNVMEHVIRMGQPDTIISSLQKSLGDNVAVGAITVMVDLISKNFEDSDCVGLLKSTKTVNIPAGGVTRLKCRIKGDVRGMDLSFIVSAPTSGCWNEDLEVTNSLGEIVRGRTPHVNIEIRNNSKHAREIGANTVVGEICAVNAVIPIPISKASMADISSVSTGEGKLSVREGEGESEVSDIPEHEKWQPSAKLDHLPPEQRAEIEKLLRDECELFAKNDTDIGEIPDLQMEINVSDETPVNEAYRHLPRKLYDDVKTYINDLIINGWVQESTSAYASPIVCVRKKDGTMRLCCDYRKLNLKMIPDRHPIPRVQDLLDGLHGQKVFTTLDMAKAYHQGFIKDNCRKYTAFATPWALYEWLRIPFGLKNAPAAFQRYICRALMGLLDRACLAYLDDILVYGKNFKEHVTNLRKVFRRLRSKGIKLRVDKCCFAMAEVRYLGRLVSEHGYRPDPEDIKALEKFRTPPSNVGEVRSMVGFFSYYRAHVPNFAKRMKPVYDLLKLPDAPHSKSGYNKRRSIAWSPDLQKIIDDVIDTLKSTSVMAYPNFDEPFILNCDASGFGLGAVLYQRQNDDLKVISYASRTLTPAEQNYHLHSGKLEFLALKWAVTDKFSDYLGHGSTFTVYTDNNPLTYVMTSAKLNATGMRWVGELSDYDFTIKYRPGKQAADADGLSRNPLPVTACADDFCDSPVIAPSPTAAAAASATTVATVPPISELERECVATVTREDLSAILRPPPDACCDTVDLKLIDLTSYFDPSPPPDLEPITKEDLSKAQSEDAVIGPIYKALSVAKRPRRTELASLSRKSRSLCQQWNKLSLVDGVMLRKTEKYTQIVLPVVYHQMVYDELHVRMGHLVGERVEMLARQRFYWPNMGSDIDTFVHKRCSCLFAKEPNVKEKAKLVPIPASAPFEIVSVDFLKIPEKGKGGYEQILVICDHFTRFTQAYACKNKSSRAAANKIFNNFILQFGFPKRIP